MVARNTTEHIIGRGPEFRPRNMLTVGSPDAVRFVSMTDTTTTIAQILLYGEIIGTGVARRHPQDARDEQFGMALATSRAFMDAGARYAKLVDSLLNPEPDPSATAIKALRKLNKSGARHRKDARRAAARGQHRKTHGWDHTNRPTVQAFREVEEQ